ncbi:hypothetical protein GCM10009132_00540 [Serratia ureilytica]
MNGHPPDTTARQRPAGRQQRPAARLQDSECGAGIAGCKRGCVRMEARRGETAGRLPAQHDSRPQRGTPKTNA